MPEEDQNTTISSEVNELKEALMIAEKARDEYLAGWQRAKADFINYKQDERKRFEDMARYGNEGMIREIIDLLDTFNRAIRELEKAGPVEKGLYLIQSQMENLLKKRGAEKIPIKLGDLFDPMMMESMAEVASKEPIGAVIEEIEPGYRLYDKILRASRVIISKGNEQ